jgi:hypothetical protein
MQKRMQRKKLKSLKRATLLGLDQDNPAKIKKESAFMDNVMNRIIANLQLRIKNLHVRFEHDVLYSVCRTKRHRQHSRTPHQRRYVPLHHAPRVGGSDRFARCADAIGNQLHCRSVFALYHRSQVDASILLRRFDHLQGCKRSESRILLAVQYYIASRSKCQRIE